MERKDFNALITDLGIQATKKEIEQMFKEADKDSDNKIAEKEFLYIFQNGKDDQLQSNGLKELSNYILQESNEFQAQQTKKKTQKKPKKNQKKAGQNKANATGEQQRTFIFSESIECNWQNKTLRWYVATGIKASQLQEKETLASTPAYLKKYNTNVKFLPSDIQTDKLTEKRYQIIGKIASGSSILANEGEIFGIVGVHFLIFNQNFEKILINKNLLSPAGQQIIYVLENDYVPYIKFADKFLLDILSSLFPTELEALRAWLHKQENQFLTHWQLFRSWEKLKTHDVKDLAWLRTAIDNIPPSSLSQNEAKSLFGGTSKLNESDTDLLNRQFHDAAAYGTEASENDFKFSPESLNGPFYIEFPGKNLIKKFYYLNVDDGSDSPLQKYLSSQKDTSVIQFVDTKSAYDSIAVYLQTLEKDASLKF